MILLTGANGFLGNYIYRSVHLNSVVACLSKSSGDYILDLSESVPVFKSSFKVVIHAAGLAHFRPINQLDSGLFHKVNFIGTKNLLYGLEKSGVPEKFVFISSVAVYGLSSGFFINEFCKLNPKEPFGKSKFEAEKLVLDWCAKNNVLCTILRLPLVVGCNPPGNLGSMIEAIKKGIYFNIRGKNSKRSMVLGSDVGNFILKAAQVGGIYNLTDGQHPTFFALSNHLAFQLKKNAPRSIPYILVKFVALFGDLIGKGAFFNSYRLKNMISELTFDDSKARIAFGWNPVPVLGGFVILNTYS